MLQSPFLEIAQNQAIQPYLPFFFILAVVFGLLEIVDVFKRKSVNLIIALVFAFFAAGYEPFVTFFFEYFGLILWSFVGLFFIAFFFEALGMRKSQKVGTGRENIPIMVGGVVLLVLTTVGIQYLSEFRLPFLNNRNMLLLIGLVLLGIIFYYAYEYGGQERDRWRSAAQQG